MFIRHQYLAAGVEGGANILLAGVGDIVGVAAHGKRFGHLIKMTGALLTIACNARLITDARGEITDN